MTPARDICDLLAARANSSGHVASRISDAVFREIITVLRQRFGMTYLEAELLLIDVAREHEKVLYAALHNRLSLDEALDAVHLYLEDDR